MNPSNITITPPPQGYKDFGNFLSNLLTLAFILAIIIVLFMLVWGAIQWILSGGDKDAVKSARERIIHALVGFAILAVAFAIAKLAGTFLGFQDIFNFTIPSPSP
ncbi:hypothetical protein HY386_01515 [Candidatus Daviesbacteria bacterium]|nr:hypothetical protein [Candidatus Daviesbacteria bacterium]